MRSTLRKVVLAPYTFTLINWAAVAGLYYFVRGTQDLWNPTGTRRD